MEEVRRTTLRSLKSRLNGESVLGDMRNVSDNLFDLFQKATLQIFCTLYKEVIVESWA